jgi:hypothetical protein
MGLMAWWSAMRPIALWALALLGCAGEQMRALAQVEALFDVPREYRILSTLPCAEGAALVYVVSAAGDLYSFEPEALAFKRIGRLDCPARFGATPNSMAVDRSGTAWLSYTDGTLFKASTRDAHCNATGFRVHQHGFASFGMAFVSTGKDLTDETLFVWGGHLWGGRFVPSEGDWPEGDQGAESDAHGLGLARVDRKNLRLEPIGRGRGALGFIRADLTGTGDGRLYGFFASRPSVLAEIDVRTGATRDERPLDDITTGDAWAFSAWGGAFWMYWAPRGRSSRVTRMDADGTTHDVLVDIGFRIVGAGVSTCAPTTAGKKEG